MLRCIASVAVLAVTLGVSSVPLTQTAGSNIRMLLCNVHTHERGVKHKWVDPYGYLHPAADFPAGQAFISITYRNIAEKTLASVDFGLVSRGELVAVAHDDEDLKPNARTGREFVILRQAVERNLTSRFEVTHCEVLAVNYADGTSWRNPKPPF